MKLIRGVVACIGLVGLFSAAFLLGDDESSDLLKPGTPFSYKLSKREFNGPAGRTTFTLDVTPVRPHFAVTAVCMLHGEQQSIGRFPLGNVNADVADAPSRFRVICLANEFIDKSLIRIEVRDGKDPRQVRALEIALREAAPEAASTSVERP